VGEAWLKGRELPMPMCVLVTMHEVWAAALKLARHLPRLAVHSLWFVIKVLVGVMHERSSSGRVLPCLLRFI
jgi:hypothetical protein